MILADILENHPESKSLILKFNDKKKFNLSGWETSK